ncbi:MAG: hypothetical protein OXB96_02650 [Candidatus Kaiserbacteria bacterium]|nr:hypothetical protein [Candidatus Kaiserbacteria bacterium]
MIISKSIHSYLIIIFLLIFLFGSAVVYAASTTTFTIVINSTSLAVSIVDGSGTDVISPAVTFSSTDRNDTCTTVTGKLGTATQKIQVNNPGAADGGWVLSIAAAATTDTWTSSTDSNKKFDFNDPGGSGCTDGSDTDGFGGQLSIDASGSTLTGLDSVVTTGISKGSSGSFSEGSTDSIALLTAASSSADFGKWDLTDVSLSQEIPASQAAANDYSLSMVLTVTAQ